jgi:hypothetical protein
MNYQIAIPTYKRYADVRKKTIETLLRHDADPARITVFVASEAERERYAAAIGPGFRIVVGQLGISNQRKFISNHYPAGTRILSLDDDVTALKEKQGKRMVDCRLSIDEISSIGFGLCEKHNAKLWGIYPVANGFFLKDKASLGLKFVCGIFFGSYAGDPVLAGFRDNQSSGEDLETTLLSFKRYGSTVRIDWICPTTKYFADGGIDAELKDRGIGERNADNTRCLLNIEARHSDLVTSYVKAGDVTNLRFKRITTAEYSRSQLTDK